MRAFFDMWRRIADYSGRTSRRDYWTALLIFPPLGLAVILASGILCICLGYGEFTVQVFHWCHGVIGIFFIPALLSMTVRRLRDAGYWPKALWWLLIPVFGGMALLARLCESSKDE